MRKNFGVKPMMYPQPVLVIGSYDEEGTPNAMTAAWGSMSDMNQAAVYISAGHKSMKNILKTEAFTISMANVEHMVEADYVGMVSGNTVPDKVAKAGLHVTKSEFVNAPLFEEFPMSLECKLVSYDPESELALGEIINVSADESILGENGHIDLAKLQPIIYDPVHHAYRGLGEIAGMAYKVGEALKKKYE